MEGLASLSLEPLQRRQTPTNLLKPYASKSGRQTPTNLLKPSSSKSRRQTPTNSTKSGRQTQTNSTSGALCRSVRASYAREFRRNYIYGKSPCDPELYEHKVCIWSGDDSPFPWTDLSSGFQWVAVHGVDSICVVTAADGVDMNRVKGFLKDKKGNEILSWFLYSVISEIEELADPSSQLRGRLAYLSNEKPFSVVSLIPDKSESDEEAQIVKNYEKMTKKFLEEKMKSSDSTSTASKTIQTAISALQQLFGFKLKADEIQGCVVKDGMQVLKFLKICDVEKHLAAIKEQQGLDNHR